MTLDHQVQQAFRHVADHVAVPEVDLDAVRSQARRNRRRAVSVGVVAAVVALALAGTALMNARDVSRPDPVDPSKPGVVGLLGPDPVDPSKPGIVVGDVPVWYDAAGLHRGDVVEETPIRLTGEGDWEGGSGATQGVLALVRNGAMYLDPDNGDVWYHPWGGEPRVLGGSATGPGGDPNSSIAAWFEGDELVVYDTAEGREVSRTEENSALEMPSPTTEHLIGGNGLMHVSADEVVWRSVAGVHRLDLRTAASTVLLKDPTKSYDSGAGGAPLSLGDVHGTTQVWAYHGSSESDRSQLQMEISGRERSLPKAFEPIGRLSADGSYLLAPTGTEGSHGAAIVDVRSGEIWDLPPDDFYGWISWSYGDIATVVINEVLDDEKLGEAVMACDASARSCDQLPVEGDFLMPTS